LIGGSGCNVTILSVTLSDLFLLLIGGSGYNGLSDEVELTSLDPKNNPVPERLKSLNKFPLKIWFGGGGVFSSGNNTGNTREAKKLRKGNVCIFNYAHEKWVVKSS
jgi:hypothetical protein